jgi:predicted transcriptional regulator
VNSKGWARHRCGVELCASILSLVGNGPMRKTWIMNGANMNHALATKQLKRLLKCGFLNQVENSDEFELTEDGRGFLSEYDRFKRLEDALFRADTNDPCRRTRSSAVPVTP